MSLEFGYCERHKRVVFDYCPECEPETDKEVEAWKEREGYA